MIDPFVGFGFGSSLFNVPGHDNDKGIQAAIGDTFSYPQYPPSSSTSFGAGQFFLPSIVPYPSFDYDLISSSSSMESVSGFQVGLDDKPVFDLDLDVPEFDFELGDGGVNMTMKDDDLRCSLAAWAGYE